MYAIVRYDECEIIMQAQSTYTESTEANGKQCSTCKKYRQVLTDYWIGSKMK